MDSQSLQLYPVSKHGVTLRFPCQPHGNDVRFAGLEYTHSFPTFLCVLNRRRCSFLFPIVLAAFLLVPPAIHATATVLDDVTCRLSMEPSRLTTIYTPKRNAALTAIKDKMASTASALFPFQLL